MKNQAFSKSSLSRCLRSIDFYNDKSLSNETYKDIVIDNAIRISESYFKLNSFSTKKIIVNNKTGYKVTDLAGKLILRRCVSNIKNLSKTFTANRTLISRELISNLKEASSYRVYRLDVNSFFESININWISSILENINGLSKQTKNIIKSYLEIFKSLYGNGLPRGIEISPILADLLMHSFDSKTINQNEVFYYTRYVDDIVIITSSVENEKQFKKKLIINLPNKLRFNINKEKIITIPKHDKSHIVGSTNDELAIFNFLGYQYIIRSDENNHSKAFRQVDVNIAGYKIKEIKTKIESVTQSV